MSALALRIESWYGSRSRAPASAAVLAFVWLLPFHSLLMATLVGSGSISFDTIRAVAAWKEIAVVVLLAWIAARSVLGRGPGVSMSTVDLLMGGMLGLAVLFVLLENPLLRAGIPQGAELYGFRDTVFFMALYFVGRATPELADRGMLLRNLFLLGVVVSAIGILERLFVTPEMLVVLGVAAYVNDFLGMSAFTAGSQWGLPQNYWTIIGGVAVQRAGSVFLHSQGFALPFLLLIPAATAWALSGRRRFPVLARILYALLWAGLLASITRMTILVCLIQVFLYFAVVRRPEWTVGSVVAAGVVFAVALMLIPGLPRFVWETMTWQTGSSESHLKDWSKGLIAFLEQPWGHGLGTSEQVAIRFGLAPVSADNMFLAYGTQLGVLGLAGLVAALGSFAAVGWRVSRSGADADAQQLGIAVLLASVGVLINGITSSVFSSNFLAYLFFLTAGVAVTVGQRSRASAPVRSRGP